MTTSRKEFTAGQRVYVRWLSGDTEWQPAIYVRAIDSGTRMGAHEVKLHSTSANTIVTSRRVRIERP